MKNRRYSVRRLLGVLGTVAALALVGMAAPNAAHADLVPCDPLFDCPPGTVHAPDRVAMGVDRDLDDAQAEAEEQAANSCPGGGFDVVRVRAQLLANGTWKYTLTYRCDSPPYD
jgi:hypothetical protein